MSLDNKNNNNSDYTEDIFEIMERYNASRSQASQKTDDNKSQAQNTRAKKSSSDIIGEMTAKPSSKPETLRNSRPAESKQTPSRQQPQVVQKQAKPEQPDVKKPARKKKKSLASRLKGVLGISPKKKSMPKPKKPTSNTEATHGPRPADIPAEPAEAKINSTALKNHFSENATAVPQEDRKTFTNTSMNIAAHLADTATVQTTDPVVVEPVKDTGAGRVKNFFIILWNALTNMSFLAKAVVYVATVLVISAYVSYYAITIANDVFAFVKTDREITLNIPVKATDKEIAYLLKKNGLISYDWMFELYMIYKTDGDAPTEYIPGEKKLNATMNYNQLISELTTVKIENEQVSITIPEGFTTDQIIDLLVSSGIGTYDGFVEAINNYPYKHEFVVWLDTHGYPATRKYRLEGYLYPDTYFFYKTSDEYVVINKMLNNFQDKFWRHLDVFKEDIEKFGLTPDDIVTIASMIQAEAKHFIDFEAVSYVFHNRLSHPGTFPYLQSDATIQYVLDEHVDDFTQEQLDLDNPYNTYKYTGLPPGAICNPGYDALSAAIYPDAPTDGDGNSINAYYFVSNKSGKTYYAETRAQHDRNKVTVKKDNEDYEKQKT